MKKYLSITLSVLLLLSISIYVKAELQIEKLAKKQWLQISNDNFLIITDADEKTGNVLIRDLENFRFFIAHMLKRPLMQEGRPLKILAIENSKTFEQLDLPEQWGGVYLKTNLDDYAIANIRNYSLRENAQTFGNHILLHEYVHFASRNLLSKIVYPLWYSEGEAEYLATFRLVEKKSAISIGSLDVIGSSLYNLKDKTGVKTGDKYLSVDVENLFKTKNINMDARRDDEDTKEKKEARRETSKFYARAMITYHYLQSTPELRDQSRVYLALVNQGNSVDDAFKSAFNVSYEDMNKAISKYMTSKYVAGWKFKFGEGGLEFPKKANQIESLSSAKAISALTMFIAQVGAYKKEEKEKLFQYARENGDKNADLLLAEIAWKSRTSQDVNQLLVEASNKFPNNTDLTAVIANFEIPKIIKLFNVGHPKAKQELIKLRKKYREAAGADPFNRQAFYGLAYLAGYIEENEKPLLNEAIMALDSAKLLMHSNYLGELLVKEMSLYSLLESPDELLLAKRQYAAISDSSWIETGYGRFIREMLELRHQGMQDGSVTENKITYENGSEYIGEIKNNRPDGKGILSLGGSQLSGTFFSGKLEGDGELKTVNSFYYRGQFKDGSITGMGELTFPEKNRIIRQKGNFLMGQEHGIQEMEMANGDRIKRFFKVGYYHGKMEMHKKDGMKLEREFFRGFLRYKITDSLLFNGAFDENYLPKGFGTCYDLTSDDVYYCKYEEGKITKV